MSPPDADPWSPVALPNARGRQVRSAATGADYRLCLAVPPGSPPPEGFATIYVLDGATTFACLADTVARLGRRGDATGVSPAIVVGIGSATGDLHDVVRRHMDFTPGPSTDDDPLLTRVETGGADRFLTFIENEVKPLVAGLLAVALADVLFATLDPDTGYPVIGLALGLLGVGAAVANVPRTDLLFRSVRDDRVGVAAGLNGSSFLLGEALGNIAVTAMIALTAAAGWQATMVSAGMGEQAAADAWATAQRALFLHTAHPFLQPSFLDVVRDLPGWSAAFTQGFTSAMVVLAVVAIAGALVAFVGLRRLRLEDAAPPRPVAEEVGA